LGGFLVIVGFWFLRKALLLFLSTLPLSSFHTSNTALFCRVQVLRQLNKALRIGENLSLVGEQRIGKTSLLKTWQQQLEMTGRVVVFVDGLKTAASVAEFVQAIT